MSTQGFMYEYGNFYKIHYLGVKGKGECVCYHLCKKRWGGQCGEDQNIFISMYLPVCEKMFPEGSKI